MTKKELSLDDRIFSALKEMGGRAAKEAVFSYFSSPEIPTVRERIVEMIKEKHLYERRRKGVDYTNAPERVQISIY